MQIIEEEPQSADNTSQKNPEKKPERKDSYRSSRSNTPLGNKKNLKINVKSTFSPKKNKMESPASPTKKGLTK